MRILTRCRSLALLAILLSGLAAPACAGMVGTDEVLSDAETHVTRAELAGAFDRETVRDALRERGVSPAAAEARVARLTDAEVARLQGRIDALPAGGDISTV